MGILKTCLAISAAVLAVVLATPVLAHLMMAGHGTVNIVDNGAFMVLSLPVSAFDGVDDNGDGEVSPAEFNHHHSEVIRTLSRHVILRDLDRELPLQGIMLSPAVPHDDDHDHITNVTVLGRFALDNARPPLSFHVDLFGTEDDSRSLTIRASRKSENLRHEFELTPEAPTALLFPPADTSN